MRVRLSVVASVLCHAAASSNLVMCGAMSLACVADEICQAVREHPLWQDEGRSEIRALREQAAEMRCKANEADRQAEDARVLVLWLERVAHDELFVPTLP
jgi:hypothetical protein